MRLKILINFTIEYKLATQAEKNAQIGLKMKIQAGIWESLKKCKEVNKL